MCSAIREKHGNEQVGRSGMFYGAEKQNHT